MVTMQDGMWMFSEVKAGVTYQCPRCFCLITHTRANEHMDWHREVEGNGSHD